MRAFLRTSTLGFMLALTGLAVSTGAQAASSKRIQHSIDAEDLNHVDFEISVAELEIEIYDGDTVEIDIDLRADRDWWFFGRGDVDDVDLTIREDGESLGLILDGGGWVLFFGHVGRRWRGLRFRCVNRRIQGWGAVGGRRDLVVVSGRFDRRRRAGGWRRGLIALPLGGGHFRRRR